METLRLAGETMILAQMGQQQIAAAIMAWARRIGRKVLARTDQAPTGQAG